MPRRATLLSCLGALALLWGLAFVGIKEALHELSPTTLTLLRFAIADLTLLVVAAALPAARPTFPKGQRWRLLALAATGVPLYHLPLNWGETRTTAQVASLIVAMAPVLLAIGGVVLLGERMTTQRILGIGAAFAGVVVLTLGTPQSATVRITPAGVLAVAIAPIAWTAYTLVAKPLLRIAQPLQVTTTTLLLGSLTLLPLFSGATVDEVRAAGATTWWWALLLGIGSSVVGYLLFVWLIQHVDASESGIVLYLVPIVGVTASGILLDEPLGWAVAVAAVLVVGGLALTQRTPPAIPAPEA